MRFSFYRFDIARKLSILFFLAAFLPAAAIVSLGAEEKNGTEDQSIAEEKEESIFKNGSIDIKGGLSYTRWDVDDGLYSDFIFEPVVVKSLDVQFRNFTGIDWGLNYLSDKIISNLGFSSPDDIYQTDTTGVRQLRLTVESDRDRPASWGGYLDVKSYRGVTNAAGSHLWA